MVPPSTSDFVQGALSSVLFSVLSSVRELEGWKKGVERGRGKKPHKVAGELLQCHYELHIVSNVTLFPSGVCEYVCQNNLKTEKKPKHA